MTGLPIRPVHILAGLPAVAVLLAATALAWGAGSASPGPVSTSKAAVVRVRALLLAAVPVGTPVDAAMARLKTQNMPCTMSEPPLANLTWPLIACTMAPTGTGTTLRVDIAARNGVVADIGVENVDCGLRADSSDPAPPPLDCDISSPRLLDLDARRRRSESAFLAEVLGPPPSSTAQARR